MSLSALSRRLRSKFSSIFGLRVAAPSVVLPLCRYSFSCTPLPLPLPLLCYPLPYFLDMTIVVVLTSGLLAVLLITCFLAVSAIQFLSYVDLSAGAFEYVPEQQKNHHLLIQTSCLIPKA